MQSWKNSWKSLPTTVKPASRKPTHKETDSRARRRGFFLFTISFPFILLLLLEILLRLFHYGPDVSLFRTEEIAGHTYHIMNPEVKARYFSRVQFSPTTSMDYFSVPKPPGAYRIFCLGGSTTAGYPYGYIGSFSTFLRDRLHHLFPDRQIEIINLGLTATNSFTVLDFARDVVKLEPDLLLVYDGHNEFYGALGVASNESFGRTRWLTRLYLNLVHSKVFLLLRDAYNGILDTGSGPSGPSKGGTMMERLALGQYVPYRNPTYQSALSIFLANVAELIDLCHENRVPLILSSQVSNLRHQKPFVSGDSELSPEVRASLKQSLSLGTSLLEHGKPDSALTVLHRFLSHDSLRADLHYEIAQCYDALGLKHNAWEEYARARDYDQLRFRMSTDFNNALKMLAGENGTMFVDIEELFRGASPDSIVGNELMLEHLHPTARGYFLMAKEYARTMRKNGLLEDETAWAARDTIRDQVLWEERALTELDERAALRRTEILVSSWPFTERDKIVPQPGDRIGKIIDDMLSGTIAWEQAHVSAAEHYEGIGDLARAEKEYQALIHMIPVNVSAYLRLARLYLKQLKYDPAREILLKSMIVEPTAYACRGLGTIAMDSGNPREAIGHLEKAVTLSQTTSERNQGSYMLALAFGRANMTEQAIRQLQNILRIDPGFKPAQELLRRLGAQK